MITYSFYKELCSIRDGLEGVPWDNQKDIDYLEAIRLLVRVHREYEDEDEGEIKVWFTPDNMDGVEVWSQLSNHLPERWITITTLEKEALVAAANKEQQA